MGREAGAVRADPDQAQRDMMMRIFDSIDADKDGKISLEVGL